MSESIIPSVNDPTSLPGSGLWGLDTGHSTVTFSVVHHQVSTFRSSFINVDGEYHGASEQFVGEVAVENMTIAQPRLREHLMSSEFFDAQAFPTFSFASTKITKDGENLAVEGDLTLRGVMRKVTGVGVYHPRRLVFDTRTTSERFGIDLTTTIDRREFGVSFNNFIADGVVNLGWIVKLEAALEFVKKQD